MRAVLLGMLAAVLASLVCGAAGSVAAPGDQLFTLGVPRDLCPPGIFPLRLDAIAGGRVAVSGYTYARSGGFATGTIERDGTFGCLGRGLSVVGTGAEATYVMDKQGLARLDGDVLTPLPGIGRVTAVAETADGQLLAGLEASRQVVAIGPGGDSTVVAGRDQTGARSPGPASDGDGGRAVDAGLVPAALLPLPGSGFLVLDVGRRAGRVTWEVREVTPDGIIERFSGPPASAVPDPVRITVGAFANELPLGSVGLLAPAPDGGFVISDGSSVYGEGGPSSMVWVSRDGRVQWVAGEAAGAPGAEPGVFDGDGGPLAAAPINPSALAVDRDGGIYFFDALTGRLRYVPSVQAPRLAVAIRGISESVRGRLAVRYAATRAVAPTLDIVGRKGRTISSARASAPATSGTISLRAGLEAGVRYTARLSAASDGQVARVRSALLARKALPLRFGRKIAEMIAAALHGCESGPCGLVGRCYRLKRGRLGCEAFADNGDPGFACDELVVIEVRGDGQVYYATRACPPGRPSHGIRIGGPVRGWEPLRDW